MRISDWSSDVCSSDLAGPARGPEHRLADVRQPPHQPARAVDQEPAGGLRRTASLRLRNRSSRSPRPAGAFSFPDHVARVSEGHPGHAGRGNSAGSRSEEHKSELQSPRRISYAVFGMKEKTEEN